MLRLTELKLPPDHAEGAGYAGGIFSAGADGIRVAEAVARDMAGLEAAAA